MTRTEHTLHTLTSFPVCSLAFVGPAILVIGGGGGASRSGIKNKLRLCEISKPDLGLSTLDEYELGAGEDAPMTIGASLTDDRIVCGINSTEDKISSGENENLRMYSVKENKITPEIQRQTIRSRDIEVYQRTTAFSPDRTFVAAGSTDNEVALMNFPSLTPACEPIFVVQGDFYDTSISTDHLVVASSSHFQVYDLPKSGNEKSLASPEPLHSIKRIERPVLGGVAGDKTRFRAARFSPTDPSLLHTVLNPMPGGRKGADQQSYVCTWDTAKWTVKRQRAVSKKPITVFDVSEDGRLLAWGSSDLRVGVLDAKTLAPLFTILRAHELPPTVLKFSPDATLLVSGSADNTIRVISVPDHFSSSFPTITILIIALLAILLAVLAQRLM